jgi:hypothetical protein
MLDRMRTGRFKVFSTCVEWFEEMRMYHRAPRKTDPTTVEIVKRDDDILSATRYAMMMLRAADTEPVHYDDYEYDDRRRSANSWTGY